MKNLIFIILLCLVSLLNNSCTGCNGDDEIIISRENNTANETQKNEPKVNHTYSGGRFTVPMKKENGVYKIKAKINGQELDFIFDTGAGLISISSVEATLLYKEGKISKDDYVGKESFQDATGNISEGVIINLKEVTIGDRTVHNIQASVTKNENAPVLFGQTALEKFGKITIDYQNLELIFE